jgi:hypothetical protein
VLPITDGRAALKPSAPSSRKPNTKTPGPAPRARKLPYDDERPTTTLPGSGGAVVGTAVTDWVDEDKGKIDFSGQKDANRAAEKASKEAIKTATSVRSRTVPA